MPSNQWDTTLVLLQQLPIFSNHVWSHSESLSAFFYSSMTHSGQSLLLLLRKPVRLASGRQPQLNTASHVACKHSPSQEAVTIVALSETEQQQVGALACKHLPEHVGGIKSSTRMKVNLGNLDAFPSRLPTTHFTSLIFQSRCADVLISLKEHLHFERLSTETLNNNNGE